MKQKVFNTIGKVYDSSELSHYGMPRRSGRYPWGSGKEPYQHGGGPDLYGRYKEEKKKHPDMSDTDLCRILNVTTKELRDIKTMAKDDEVVYQKEQWTKLREKGWSDSAIARRYNVVPTTVKNRIEKPLNDRITQIKLGTDELKKAIDEHGYIDVGAGSLVRLGINDSRKEKVVARLKKEGYVVQNLQIPQGFSGNKTTVQVIAAPGTTYQDFKNNKHNIHLVDSYIEKDGRTVRNLEPPVSVDSKRVKIAYSSDKDGMIELRRSAKDLSLGNADYAQVRIAVDGTHYIKGVAVYGDNMPKGTDIVFHTNKPKGTPMMGDDSKKGVLKKMETTENGEVNLENPFGATIKPSEKLVKAQKHYMDSDGKEKLSPINVVYEEGDWNNWSRSLAAQFLSKQPRDLVSRQLNYTVNDAKAELKDIQSLNNPIVKKYLLDKFADQCDYNSVHLKAASLPRQTTNVILPIQSLKENEVYAPNYRNGETLTLIRYPHGGKFEIPELRVNNNSIEAKRIIKNAPDAIGIHPKVAGVLSGADFDGDTVVTIPKNRRVHIETQKPLDDLKGFEPKVVYAGNKNTKVMKNTQTEMGKISNLIMDMTIARADDKELARAIKHSMVVIDAEKHGLDYQRSEKDNDIKGLRIKYRGDAQKGASTLITKAKSEYDVPERAADYKIDPKTGEKIPRYTGNIRKKYVDPDTGKAIPALKYESGKYAGKYKYDAEGKRIYPPGGVWVESGKRTTKSTYMAETKDARTLLSDTPSPVEKEYAAYANQMKALANEARKSMVATPSLKRNPAAAKTYAKEVDDIKRKLREVDKQRPLERQAVMIADSNFKAIAREDPTIYVEPDRKKKVYHQALEAARYRVGKNKPPITITDREWEAIQAGAVHNATAERYLMAADIADVRERATPRSKTGISQAKVSRIQAMLSSGMYTQQEIADKLGVSTSTVRKYM